MNYNFTDNYAYWDLIAEEAYYPNDELLKLHKLELFQENLYSKNIYMFGCNAACKEFIETNPSLQIKGVLDNSEAKIGTEYVGVKVLDPNDVVPNLDDRDIVIIAMRLNSDKIARQLSKLGFNNYFSLGVLLACVEPYHSFIMECDKHKEADLEDMIIFESTNDFDGNAGAIYDYLKANGTNHKCVWVIKNPNNANLKKSEDDIAICPSKDTEELKKYIEYRSRAKWIIWDNHPIRKVREGQINIFLQHYGMGYKQIANIFNCPSYVDFALNTTEDVYRYEKHALLYSENTKMILGELPRNDVLFDNTWNELEKITDKHYNKVIMWAPTLRSSAMYNRVDSDIDYPMGISLLYTEADLKRVNDFLADVNSLLIIKIHPRQKRNYLCNEYSNILYLDGESVKKVHSYKLMTQMDAMITDYSSMVFDYMLLDRPIAWVLEDMEHYKIPFLMDNPLDFMPGEHIYYVDQLLNFIGDVCEGKDLYKEQRNALSNIYNAPKEGKGCEKIVEILGL